MERRAAGHPLEHVVGWAEFAGLRIAVGPGVFVPRRRTEFLLALARDLLARAPGPVPVAVDLCCGSGAAAAALAASGRHAEVHAADIDPVAAGWARRNLAGAGEVHEGDLYAALPAALRGRVAVLVANVPYVPTAAFPCCPPRPAPTNPGSPSTAATTAWRCCGGSPQGLRSGSPRAAPCWWRRPDGRRRPPARCWQRRV
ncbi:methyltransferase domain-containing protein [Actinomadura keratinilytica]